MGTIEPMREPDYFETLEVEVDGEPVMLIGLGAAVRKLAARAALGLAVTQAGLRDVGDDGEQVASAAARLCEPA